MSSTSSALPSSSTSSAPNNNNNNNNQQNGVSSSLYLFTFLITVLVLAVISGALLFRAYYIRRRFQARVEEAIRNNEPLPPDAARALGLIRPGAGGMGKKDKRLGPMPGIWEAEMWLDRKAGEMDGGCVSREEWDRREKSNWEEFMPVAVVHFPSDPSPDTYHPQFIIPPPRQRRYLPSWFPVAQPLPRPIIEAEQTPANIPRSGPKWTIPPSGEQVSVGVMIALPFEEKVGDLWTRRGEEEEEGEVPHVVLGVIATRTE